MKRDITQRRAFLKKALLGAAAPGALLTALAGTQDSMANSSGILKEAYKDNKKLLVTSVKLYSIKVNHRGSWYFIELSTNKGITGLGECSHGVTGLNSGDDQLVEKEIANVFKLIEGESPYDIEKFRLRGFSTLTTKLARTVFSGMEQALWDINGKAANLPSYNLLGGKLRDTLDVYANINRAVKEKDANGRRLVSAFQKQAELAVGSGFKAIKMAPFDEMKPLSTNSPEGIKEDVAHGIKCINSVRETIGKDIQLLVDVHSHFDQTLSVDVAKQLEAANLYWYEEPVDPNKYHAETLAINTAIGQPLAGGEAIYRREGFSELIQTNALDILMPDVKHCGGLLELKYIAALGEAFHNLKVAPHNPSGPIATMATKSVCAGMPNFLIMEYAFGEVPC